MEKTEERKAARRIIRRVAKELRSRGFLHLRPTFLIRPLGLFAQFVHFHKFTFGPRFRVHLGIRVMNDPFAAFALNGPSFEHAGSFDSAEEETLACTHKLIRLIEGEGLPWFATLSTADDLLRSSMSPLRDEDRSALLDELAGRKSEANWRLSAQLLSLSSQKGN